MTTDILLIHPNYLSKEVYGSLVKAHGLFPPLGLGYLASYLEKKGFKVKILDFDASDESYESIITKYNPNFIGIHVTSPVFNEALKICRIAKKINKNIKTILGGPHVTAIPEFSLKNNEVDFIVYGEGEETIAELLDFIEKNKPIKNVRGIYYKKRGKIKKNNFRPLIKDINKLPFPAYHLLPMKKYKFYAFWDVGKGFTTMITTRGCPFGCVFCNTRTMFGTSLRFRNAKNIIDEVELLNQKYKVKDIYFYDDALTLSEKHTNEFCDEMKKRKLDLRWTCETRVDRVNDNLLRNIKNAGCYMVGYGFESGNDEILRRLGKNATIKQNETAAKLTNKNKMQCRAFLLLGCPGETIETMNQTINFALKNPIDFVHFNICTPYPGTPLWEQGVKEGKLSNDDFNKASAITNIKGNKKIIGSNLTEEIVKKYWTKANLKFYLRPSWVAKTLGRIENYHHFKRTAAAGLGFFMT